MLFLVNSSDYLISSFMSVRVEASPGQIHFITVVFRFYEQLSARVICSDITYILLNLTSIFCGNQIKTLIVERVMSRDVAL